MFGIVVVGVINGNVYVYVDCVVVDTLFVVVVACFVNCDVYNQHPHHI